MKKVLGITVLTFVLAGTVWCSKKDFPEIQEAEKKFKTATRTFLKTRNNDDIAKETLLKALETLASKAETYFKEPDSYDVAQKLMYKYDNELNNLNIITLKAKLNQEQVINKTALELKTAIFGAIKNGWEIKPIIQEFKNRLSDTLKQLQQEREKQRIESKKKLQEEQKELVELTNEKDMKDINELEDQLTNIKYLSGEELERANQELVESFYAAAYDAVNNSEIAKLKWIYALLPKEYKQEGKVDAIFTDLENKQPLIIRAITQITALRGNPLETKKFKEVATGIDITAREMDIIKYLVETVGVRTTGLPIGEMKVDAITLAIQWQYKPMVKYFIDHDGLKAKQIPGIFEGLFTGNRLNNTYCYYEVKRYSEHHNPLEFDDVRELVTQIGYYPCLSLVIDTLIQNNIDLATIKIKPSSSEKVLPLIEYILHKLAGNNLTGNEALDELPAKAFYELILKLYNLMNEDKLFQFVAPENVNDLLYEGLEGLKIFIDKNKFAIDKNGEAINPITDKKALKSKIEAAVSDALKTKEIEEKREAKREEELYKAIAIGDGEKIKKLLAKTIVFTQKQRNLKYCDCECPIVPWLLYYLYKHAEEKAFPSDALCDIILKRYKQLKDKNPKILVKKHKTAFFKKLSGGFKIVAKYANKKKLDTGKLKDITYYPNYLD